jgi:phosphoribosylformylglycinamidine cyclo-ligase
VSRTYRGSGVDQEAADALVGFFAKQAARTRRLEMLGDVGGFAGLFSLEGLAERGYRRPALVVSTDGVGTKVELLRAAGHHRTAGWDAVAMNVDDVVCVGAEPLLLVDYVSVESLDADVVTEIVGGVADACVEAGCALAGGETSQHPGLLPQDGYDVVATCVGVVDADRAWGPDRVRTGDAIVGLAATGPHANGFSLIRALLGPDEQPDPSLLAPTGIYCRTILEAAAEMNVHAAAHVTGGGIAGNLARALPAGVGASVDRSTWPRPGWCDWIAARGVSEEELYATFNGGLGMLLVVADGPAAVDALSGRGAEAWVVGEVTATSGIELRQR